MDSKINLALLRKFQGHVPRILVRQLISSFILEYGIGKKSDDNLEDDCCCVPSIQRLHGALLFVDISGFTALAQRLTVDKLRIQINSYFTQILNLIAKFGGDVIKFAGDALYVIWPVQNSGDFGQFDVEQRSTIVTAVTCGLEITIACSNYEINITKLSASDETSHIAAMLLMHQQSDFLKKVSPKSVSINNTPPLRSSSTGSDLEQTDSIAYLSVHAGLTIGTMASMDVGTDDCWEYLIVGEPVSEVAIAEGEASKGELVLSTQAHTLLHGVSEPRAGSPLHGVCACGCELTHSGFFKVHRVLVDELRYPLASRSCSFHGEVVDDCISVVDSFDDSNSSRNSSDVNSESDAEDIVNLPTQGVTWREGVDREVSQYNESAFVSMQTHTRSFDAMDRSSQWSTQPHPLTSPKHYDSWINSCLLEDVFRHVHEADRMHYVLQRLSRRNSISATGASIVSSRINNTASDEQEGSLFDLLVGEETPTSLPFRMVDTKESPSRPRTISNSSSSSGWFDNKRETNSTSNYSMLSLHDTTLVGELRTVVVMFVGIHMGDCALFFDGDANAIKPSERDCIVDSFNFQKRTEAEATADEALLTRYQACMEIMVRALHNKNGQLRQFIVDDKGTVCIGTFGLRGSTTNDNAAAAIEAAHDILQQLKQIDLQASIGLTSGKAYCGLVGSEERHEYSVMGPSTNLSARLMCSARPGEIRCGSEIRRQDRVHSFVPLGEVRAKGYTYTVSTYMPVFVDTECTGALNLVLPTRFTALGSNFGTTSCRRNIPVACFGRDVELEQLVVLLLPEIYQDHSVAYNVRSSVTMAVLTGQNGIGKSTLISAFSHVIASRRLIGFDHSNVCVFHDTSNTFTTELPLSAWKPILKQMVQRLGENFHLSTSSKSPEKSFYDMSDGDYLQSLETLLIGLSTDLRAPSDTNTLSSQRFDGLSMPERLAALSELTISLIVEFVEKTRDRVLIVMDDMYRMDTASLDLLYNLWATETAHGVSILLSYRPAGAPSVQRSAVTDPGWYFLKRIQPCDRFAIIKLDPLTGPAIRDLVTAIFARGDGGLRDVDEEMLLHFQTKSGGNPLYACELAKIVAERLLSVSNMGSPVGSEFVRRETSVSDILADFESSRIEEIICYRFDQLESACQLLLKMAAAACIHGGHFTLDMLVYVTTHYQQQKMSSPHTTLFDLDNDAVRENVHGLIEEILQKNEFVQITTTAVPDLKISFQSPLKTNSNSLTSPKILSENTSFEFIFELEKRSVYDLMLASQKSLLHKIIAQYLQQMEGKQEEGMNLGRCPARLHAQGRHWESAENWSTAMDCYYRSALLLDGMGSIVDSRRHLIFAHQMLDRMREAAGIKAKSSTYERMFERNSASVSGGETPSTASSDAGNDRLNVKRVSLTKIELFNIFGGDSSLLQLAVNVCVKLGLNALLSSLDSSTAALLIEQAVDMVAVATTTTDMESSPLPPLRLRRSSSEMTEKHGLVLSPPRLRRTASDDISPRSRRKSSSRSDADKLASFGIQDMTPYFPALAAIFHLYISNVLSDDERKTRQEIVVDRFLCLARLSTHSDVHMLVGLAYKRLLFMATGRVEESIAVVERMRAVYDPQLHSAELAGNYLCNRMPHHFVNHAQTLLLTGRFGLFIDHCRYIARVVNTAQLDFMGLAAYCTAHSALLGLFQSAQNGLQIYSVFTTLARELAITGHVAELIPVTTYWLQLMALQERCAVDRSDGAVRAAVALELHEMEETPGCKELLTVVLEGRYVSRMNVNGQPPVEVVTCALFAAGVEFICAHICLLKFRLARLLGGGDVRCDEYLSTALGYAESSIRFCEQSDYFVFTLLQSLLLKARVLCAMTRSDPHEATNTLLRCVDLSRRFGFHLIILQAGMLMEKFELDVQQGRALQRGAMEQIRLLNYNQNEHKEHGQEGVDWGDLSKLLRSTPVLKELLGVQRGYQFDR